MKKAIALLCVLTFAIGASAQSPDSLPAAPFFYCQIIAAAGPSPRSNEVVFDFGQPTDNRSYDYLSGDDGSRLLFRSGTEALNWMARRGWEFVQVFTSGESNQYAHYLLRIDGDKLPERLREQAFAVPESENGRHFVRKGKRK